MDSFFGLNPYYSRQPHKNEEKIMPSPEFLSIVADRHQISQYTEVGRGGEAVVYRLKTDTVAKVFLEPDDPLFAEDYAQRQAAEERISVMQTKIMDMPRDLPASVVMPNGVLVNLNKRVFGYTMPFVNASKNLSEIKKGDPKGLDIILQLYDTIVALHKANTIIGDFNENNVLIDDKRVVRLVDADSMQFGSYTCPTFVQRFTAPEYLEYRYPDELVLTRKRNEASDWYAFMVMAMRMLTNTDPYGGTVKNWTLTDRIRDRMTVFNKKVVYPVTAVPLRSLPRHILEIFFNTFHRGLRFVPERSVFEEKRMTEKARSVIRNVSPRQAKRMKRLTMKSSIARQWFKGREFASANAQAAALTSFKKSVRS